MHEFTYLEQCTHSRREDACMNENLSTPQNRKISACNVTYLHWDLHPPRLEDAWAFLALSSVPSNNRACIRPHHWMTRKLMHPIIETIEHAKLQENNSKRKLTVPPCKEGGVHQTKFITQQLKLPLNRASSKCQSLIKLLEHNKEPLLPFELYLS